MPALYPPLTALAGADVNVEPPHDRLHPWEIFLIVQAAPFLPVLPARSASRSVR
jgi:hypothetical protein